MRFSLGEEMVLTCNLQKQDFSPLFLFFVILSPLLSCHGQYNMIF